MKKSKILKTKIYKKMEKITKKLENIEKNEN